MHQMACFHAKRRRSNHKVAHDHRRKAHNRTLQVGCCILRCFGDGVPNFFEPILDQPVMSSCGSGEIKYERSASRCKLLGSYGGGDQPGDDGEREDRNRIVGDACECGEDQGASLSDDCVGVHLAGRKEKCDNARKWSKSVHNSSAARTRAGLLLPSIRLFVQRHALWLDCHPANLKIQRTQLSYESPRQRT